MNVDRHEVTVIICAFNAAKTIRDTIASLQSQSQKPAQILIVDDGSCDDTVETVQGAIQGDPTIRLISNEFNRGTAFSRQLGLKAAQTEWIMFFDADDLAHPRLIETLAQRLHSDSACMGVSCYANYFDESGTLGLQKIGALKPSEFFEMWRQNKLYFQSMVTLTYQSLCLRAGGFRQDILKNAAGVRYEDYAEDLDLWCRMADFGSEGRYFVSVPKPLFKYRKPMTSLSTKNLKLMQLKMRWIKDCLRRRRYGQSEQSLASFIASRTVWDRFNDWRSDTAAAWYKKAGFAWMRRDWLRVVIFLGLSGAFSPKLIRQKLKTQTASR